MHETEVALWKPPASLTANPDAGLGVLRTLPLFQGLKDADLKRMMGLLHERQYAADEVVFREGQEGAGLYVIQSGEVDIVLKLADGSEKLLVKLTDGRFFGELALLENAPRTATAVVRKPTVLLGLFQSDLESLIERNSKLGAGVIWNLAKLIGARLVELSTAVRTQAAKQEGAK